MVLTADPISIIPTMGMKESAWLSVHLIASDLATSSCPPKFATFVYNLPPELDDASREAYLSAIGKECGRLGVSVVAGHTGTYPGAGFTVVGAGTMFTFAPADKYLDPSMSRPGDIVLMTKGAAIETTAALANSFPNFTEEKLGRELALEARRYTHLCTTVRDALTASSVGIKNDGVTSMHDATEGGVLGGLNEMASASGHTFMVRRESIHVTKETRQLCSAFSVDPLISLSEGTLLLTCKNERVDQVTRRLRRNGIPSFAIGEVVNRRHGLLLVEESGSKTRQVVAKRDPYWRAYDQAIKLNLS
jgi:hydrogenase maturation factor